ncbi:MAG: hypothetical protein GX786_06490, partial [Clostridiales bacterium]|nr:hypothetical protein [Clostridiales bacterium]
PWLYSRDVLNAYVEALEEELIRNDGEAVSSNEAGQIEGMLGQYIDENPISYDAGYQGLLDEKETVGGELTAPAMEYMKKGYLEEQAMEIEENTPKDMDGLVLKNPEVFENPEQGRVYGLFRKYADNPSVESFTNDFEGFLNNVYHESKFWWQDYADSSYEEFYEKHKERVEEEQGIALMEPEDFTFIDSNYAEVEAAWVNLLDLGNARYRKQQENSYQYDKLAGDLAKKEWKVDVSQIEENSGTPESLEAYSDGLKNELEEVNQKLVSSDNPNLKLKKEMLERQIKGTESYDLGIGLIPQEELQRAAKAFESLSPDLQESEHHGVLGITTDGALYNKYQKAIKGLDKNNVGFEEIKDSEYVQSLEQALTEGGYSEQEIADILPKLAINLPVLSLNKKEGNLVFGRNYLPHTKIEQKQLGNTDYKTMELLLYAAMVTEPEKFIPHIEAFENNYRELMEDNAAFASYMEGSEGSFGGVIYEDLMLRGLSVMKSLGEQEENFIDKAIHQKENPYTTQVNPYGGIGAPGSQAKALQEGYLKDKSSLVSTLYNVTYGVADHFMTAGASLGNPIGYGALMGIKAQADSFAEGVGEGKKYGRNLLDSSVGAVKGGVIEGLGFDNFVGAILPGDERSIIKSIVIGAFGEGVEEIVELGTDSAYSLLVDGYDQMYMDISAQLREEYPNASDREIHNAASSAIITTYKDTFLTSAITGGIVSGVQTGSNNVAYKSNNVNTQQEIQRVQEEISRLVGEDERLAQIVTENSIVALDEQGNEQRVKEFEFDNDKGFVYAVMEDGEVELANELTYQDPGMKEVISKGAVFGDAQTSKAYVKNYQLVQVDPETYHQAFTAFYNKGRDVAGHNHNTVVQDVWANSLPKVVQEAAIKTGKQAQIADRRKAPGDFPSESTQGHSGVVKAYIAQNVSQSQGLELLAMDRLGKEYGREFVVVDTLGKKANALFDGETGKIYVGLDAQDGISKAASHELLHSIRSVDEKAYTTLKDFVVKVVEEKEGSLETAVNQVTDLHKRITGKEIGKEAAIEEVVADALPNIVLSENNMKALVQEDPTAATRLVEAIKRILKQIRDAFKGTKEYQAINNDLKAYEEAVSLFEDALRQTAQKQGIEMESDVAASLKGEDVKYSLKGYTEEEIERITRPDNTEIAQNDVDALNFINEAIRDTTNASKYLAMGKFPDATIADLEKAYDHVDDRSDYAGYSFGLHTHDIKHTYKEHGAKVQREIDRGHLPMTPENMLKAMRVVVDYDSVVHDGYDKASKKPFFVFTKDVGGTITLVTVLNDNKKMFVLKSMRKIEKKTSRSTAYDAKAPHSTSETSQDIAGNNIVPKHDKKNNKFSLKTQENADTESLMKENAKLTEYIGLLKEQFKLSKGTKLNQNDIRVIARNLIKENSSTSSAAEVTTDLATVYGHLANNPDVDMGDVQAAMSNIVKGVLRNSQQQTNLDMYEDSKRLRNYLRQTPISLTQSQMAEVDQVYGSYNDFRKQYFGTLRLTSEENGIALDSVWGELPDMMPGMFPTDINEGDMITALVEVLEGTKPEIKNDFGMD